jgi:tetratricopeptide (TPR) repeat protein
VEDKTSSSYRVVTQHLQEADLYIKDGKLPEAEREIAQARGADSASPRILLSTAKLQRARNKLPEALVTLQDYFRKVPNDDEADTLRTNIRHELNSAMEQTEKAIATAEAAGDYVKAWQAANDGLELDNGNLLFLLHSGLDGAMLRKPDAADKLDKYLSLSQTPGADQKQRNDVYNFRSQVAKPTLPKSEGTPNWFSGYNNAPGLMYCPISLMPNVHIADIKSRKQTSAFQWAGSHLLNIDTTSQDPLDKQLKISFEYSRDAVRRVGTGTLDNKDDPNSLRFTPQGAKGNGNGVYLGLPNNPVVDPIMVERLTGHPVATLVSGNRYFDPFAWVEIDTFLAEYDDQGRVKSARLISNDPTPFTLDFKWDGLRLMEITQRGGDYRRTMIYTANRLTEERITFRGKTSNIEYHYKDGQLIDADAKEDASIDNRPRHVTFRQ